MNWVGWTIIGVTEPQIVPFDTTQQGHVIGYLPFTASLYMHVAAYLAGPYLTKPSSPPLSLWVHTSVGKWVAGQSTLYALVPRDFCSGRGSKFCFLI